MPVEAEGEPCSLDAGDRPGERRVVAYVECQLSLDRALDRRAADLAVALRRVAVAGREERTVDGDRQVEGRARDELLAVDVAAARPRWRGLMGARLRGRHPQDTEERREPNRPADGGAEPALELPVQVVPRPAEVFPPRPGRDFVDPDDEGLPRAGAADLEGAGERMAGVQLRI